MDVVQPFILRACSPQEIECLVDVPKHEMRITPNIHRSWTIITAIAAQNIV
jgi:hypothetical protein